MIRRKTCASRKTDWQLCTGIYRLSGSCHSAQQLLASSLSLYLRMYICTLSKSLVYESPHVAQFPFCTRSSTSVSHQEQEANFVVNSTAFAWRLAGLAILDLCNEGTWTDTCLARHCKVVACETLRLEPRLSSMPGCRIDTKSKKECVYSYFWDVRNAITQCLRFCYMNNRIIISFLCVRIN